MGVGMTRLIEKLNSLAITKTTKPGYYGDGAGLWLQVSPSITKSWIFRFTLRGNQREMGLGALHTVSLADARLKARECRQQLLDGIDPLETRKSLRLAASAERAKVLSFDQCAAAYMDAHRNSWKNAKHAAQWESTIKTYATPVIGQLPVSNIDTALVIKVLSPIWQTKTETASRLRGRIESVLDWAATSGYRTGVNPARWRGHLENLLAKPSKVSKVVHHPALAWQDIAEFMTELREREGIAARALEFTILTASRSGEVRGAKWTEIHNNMWIVPAERMKMGKEHRVPLSKEALAILAKAPSIGDFIFPGAVHHRPLSDMSLTAVLRRMNRNGVTVHGFRSTFRDWCAESVANSFPREVCEQALAHSLSDKVEAAYRRGDLIEKRAVLMQAWATYCYQAELQRNVIQISGLR